MNSLLIILITFCSFLALFIGVYFLVKRAEKLIEKVMEAEEEMSLNFR